MTGMLPDYASAPCSSCGQASYMAAIDGICFGCRLEQHEPVELDELTGDRRRGRLTSALWWVAIVVVWLLAGLAQWRGATYFTVYTTEHHQVCFVEHKRFLLLMVERGHACGPMHTGVPR